MVSYSAEKTPPRGLRSVCAPRFPANHLRPTERRCRMTAAAAATRQATAPRPWTHYVNDHFFDRPDLEPGLERLALRLERLAREKPWCFTSNDELRHQLGCSQNTLAAILIRGESLGWFRRVLVPGRHGQATGRLGIVLFCPAHRPARRHAGDLRPGRRPDAGRDPPRLRPIPATDPPLPRSDSPGIGDRWSPGIGDRGPQELGTIGPQKLGTGPLFESGRNYRAKNRNDDDGERVVVVVGFRSRTGTGRDRASRCRGPRG